MVKGADEKRESTRGWSGRINKPDTPVRRSFEIVAVQNFDLARTFLPLIYRIRGSVYLQQLSLAVYPPRCIPGRPL